MNIYQRYVVTTRIVFDTLVRISIPLSAARMYPNLESSSNFLANLDRRDFPNCSDRRNCKKIHPRCKFGISCRIPNCPYTHADNDEFMYKGQRQQEQLRKSASEHHTPRQRRQQESRAHQPKQTQQKESPKPARKPEPESESVQCQHGWSCPIRPFGECPKLHPLLGCPFGESCEQGT